MFGEPIRQTSPCCSVGVTCVCEALNLIPAASQEVEFRGNFLQEGLHHRYQRQHCGYEALLIACFKGMNQNVWDHCGNSGKLVNSWIPHSLLNVFLWVLRLWLWWKQFFQLLYCLFRWVRKIWLFSSDSVSEMAVIWNICAIVYLLIKGWHHAQNQFISAKSFKMKWQI